MNNDIVIEEGDTVTCSCNPLDITGQGSITVKNGGALIVTSNTGVTGQGDLTVEDGGSLLVKGDLSITGSGDFTLNGDADVQGNFDVSGNGNADGSGDLNIGGSGDCGDWEGSGTCQESVPLPVELIAFSGKAKEGKVLLDWRTASEQACSHFIIQKREEGEGYQRIGRVEGSGTTVHPSGYSFADAELPRGKTRYYRLVQVDFDGERTSYGPIAVRLDDPSDADLSIHPNPVRERAMIELPELRSSKVLLSIHDMSGRLIAQEEKGPAEDGRMVLDRRSLGLDPGSYLLSIRDPSSGKHYSERLLIR